MDKGSQSSEKALRAPPQSPLFGGSLPWSPLDWTNSDDSVRGGSSYSEFVFNPPSPIAVFRGNLDIETLGGAGFASQRSTGDNRTWDVSDYDGILLDVTQADGKQYTLTLKDELLPKSPNGREQSTISWEYDFTPACGGEKVFAKWDDFNATYRGREKPDAKPLDLKSVKRISLMMRSFFGTQEGAFSLSLVSISVAKAPNSNSTYEPYRDDPADVSGRAHNEKSEMAPEKSGKSWLGWLIGFCGVA
ncbi:Uncharacterized protein LOCC1_G006140 [Lachnellula occidentalis]|uniref:NADH:ubiquinone oxidoreductase intermediate-associated protein 30 domain-containing protein n=1 Tax=Lachnellula occidentalis TaxID=215460 RepID=A0A8H8RWQ8_9HELO|nr:Uncharacterized protein LOCC1_G006140 [Lachnellula occidentalis]